MSSLFDERGHAINLDEVDAVGLLPDGRSEVWMSDERRLTTAHPEAYAVWVEHLRRKTLSKSTTESFHFENMIAGEYMQESPRTLTLSISEIVENLSFKEDRYEPTYRTASEEQYRTLIHAALNGRLEGVVSVGRSGIFLKNHRNNPQKPSLQRKPP